LSGRGSSVFLPLILAWLTVHAALLALVLGLKFLGAKTMALLFLAATAFWFLTGRRRQALPRLSGMV